MCVFDAICSKLSNMLKNIFDAVSQAFAKTRVSLEYALALCMAA